MLLYFQPEAARQQLSGSPEVPNPYKGDKEQQWEELVPQHLKKLGRLLAQKSQQHSQTEPYYCKNTNRRSQPIPSKLLRQRLLRCEVRAQPQEFSPVEAVLEFLQCSPVRNAPQLQHLLQDILRKCAQNQAHRPALVKHQSDHPQSHQYRLPVYGSAALLHQL